VPKAETDKLKAKIGELENRLAASIPMVDLESLKQNLQAKIADLGDKLAASVPRIEADTLKEKANQLEAALREARGKLNLAESKLAESILKTDAEARDQELTSRIRALESKIQELQDRLSNSENEAATLRTRITELEANKVDENLKQL
jgi:predicted  nucleic acid-binding Zn-ribbon protein